jgi:hypothetical protein
LDLKETMERLVLDGFARAAFAGESKSYLNSSLDLSRENVTPGNERHGHLYMPFNSE